MIVIGIMRYKQISLILVGTIRPSDSQQQQQPQQKETARP